MGLHEELLSIGDHCREKLLRKDLVIRQVVIQEGGGLISRPLQVSTDEQIIFDEINENIFTDTIRVSFSRILDRYLETLNKPHEGIRIWVSCFFGSGKSSFAKMLGIGLEDRSVTGKRAATVVAERSGDIKIKTLLANIAERIPTHAVIFDVSTDRGIHSGNQTITEIMYRLFGESLGYAKDLDLSELEINLENVAHDFSE